jgi:hypothetical protein
MELRTTAPSSGLQADAARRTIAGLVAPWDTYATVSTGQTINFERGSLTLGDRAKLVLDHDPGRPVGVFVSSSDTPEGLTATFRIPEGPAGDAVLAEAAAGLRDGLSVAADISDHDETDAGLLIHAARGRHVALLSEPAFDSARVSSVHASGGAPMPDTITADATAPQPAQEAPAAPAEVAAALPVPTAAGLAVAASVSQPAPVRVRDPYPYAVACEMGGPSFVRDAWSAMENPGSPEADRWRRAQLQAADPVFIQSGMARLARFNAAPAGIQAATGTTVTDPSLVPPHWMPERYVPLLSPKAPLYTALAKYGVPDFTTLQIPRTVTETGLAGVPADEVTPIAPGDITTTGDTITINEVEGSYNFSRKLLMSSNPQIDRIALDALDRAWLAEVEKEAVTYFVGGASVHTAVSATYADGHGFINALRTQFANMAAGTVYEATVVIPPSKEYIAAATVDDSTGRALLPYLGPMNSIGTSTAGYGSLSVQGVPLMPGPYQTATKTLILDQSRNSATIWVTPIMDFRLEWTDTGSAGGGNVKVLKLVKYSGVGFWSQYPGGVILMTNTTPITLEGVDDQAASGDDHEAKAKKG